MGNSDYGTTYPNTTTRVGFVYDRGKGCLAALFPRGGPVQDPVLTQQVNVVLGGGHPPAERQCDRLPRMYDCMTDSYEVITTDSFIVITTRPLIVMTISAAPPAALRAAFPVVLYSLGTSPETLSRCSLFARMVCPPGTPRNYSTPESGGNKTLVLHRVPDYPLEVILLQGAGESAAGQARYPCTLFLMSEVPLYPISYERGTPVPHGLTPPAGVLCGVDPGIQL